MTPSPIPPPPGFLENRGHCGQLATSCAKDKTVDKLVGDQQTSTVFLYDVLPVFFNCMRPSPGKYRSLQVLVFSCKFTRLYSGFAGSGGSGHCSSGNVIRLEEGRVTKVATNRARFWHTACTARRV